jgi:hypothetical protein
MDESVTPLFAHREPGRLYQVREAARLMARPGLSEEKATNQLRHFVQARWIYVQRHYKRSANLYAPSDIAAAIVISAVLDTSIADHKIMNAVALSLYTWQPGQHPQRHHPITSALCASDSEWHFEVSILRDARTGSRIVRPFCYDVDDRPMIVNDPASPVLPIATISLNLGPLLLPLEAKICATADARALDAESPQSRVHRGYARPGHLWVPKATTGRAGKRLPRDRRRSPP